MEKQEFLKLITDNIEKWADDNRKEEHKNIASYCYDVLCSDKELARVSEELAGIKQELELTKQDLEIYKSGYSRLSEELSVYKCLVKAQSDLINLK